MTGAGVIAGGSANGAGGERPAHGGTAIELAGEPVLLLPQKALVWPRARMLVVADIHFGKAASFRALGVPVPRGTTTENLAGLDALLAAHDIGHILFLGDFLHAKAAHASATLQAMLAWRERHPLLALTLVRGNHDRHAGDPSRLLRIDLVDEPHRIGPFAFCHHPDLAPGQVHGGYVLAGHVHPVYCLAGRRERLRLPCFVIGERHAILPSFGAFTGGHPVEPALDERLYLVADDCLYPLNSR
ncbi:ligase-associated DNA damage response endonuclease PdeM [Massilia dura]|uniref:Ligase-associated DNA damage response endonuclease PdeM n=1 Tax=Pseudoduganella dura TaxID=321982 RepID=A0A6I3XK64_9BURK|nr:ligase-associated DNA damage response endonuclease PdeM [Pseudoduganella dura]MUI14853.1 ligase-associated DNA damage response endonuclease PdeM [Pseudoduganella dura]GGX85664.1 DEAD/DEAH box helicase [Pseudoduganella dura]